MALRDIFKKLKLTFLDCIVVLGVLFTSLILAYSFGQEGKAATECIIKVNGEEYARYELASIDNEKVIEIKNQYGENTVVVDKNGAYVTYSDCPDNSEVKAGRICSSGESLICLPHRLEIYLSGGAGLDATSW